MRKILLTFLMMICLTVPAFAEVDINISTDGKNVELSGSSNYIEVPVSIQVFDDNRKHYIDQGETDGVGDFKFSFGLEKEKVYRGKLNIAGEKKEFELSISSDSDPVDPPITEKYVSIYIKGYKGVILNTTDVEIDNDDTVMSVTKKILNSRGITYVDRGGYIASIDGQAEFDKGKESGWMFSINGSFPDMGAGSVDVNDGDRIKWLYTQDLGEDIGGSSIVPIKEEELEAKIDKIKDIIADENSSEKEIIEAVKDITDELNKAAKKIDTQEDTQNFVKAIKNISNVMEKIVMRIATEDRAIVLAKENINMVKALSKSVEKLTNNEDKIEISKVAVKNIEMTTKVMEKINDINKANDIVEEMIEASADLIKKLGEENAEEIKQNVVKAAEKALEMASIKEIEKNELEEEKDKVVAKVDKNTIEEMAKNTLSTVKLINKKLEENGLKPTNEIENKLTIKIPKLNKKEVETKLPSGIIKALQQNGVRKALIETEIASINITAKTFGKLAEGKEISLSAKKVNKNTLSEAQRNQIPEDSQVIDLNAKLGEEKVSTFEESIEVIIPYEGKVEEGETVKVFFLADDGTIEPMEGIYNPESKTVRFKTSHFSKYFAKKVEIKGAFNDLKGYEWAKKAIKAMSDKKIIAGRREGIFDPGANITRAEFATLVIKMMGYAAENTEAPFSDVAKEAWYYNYVGTAYNNGLINGRSEKEFNPNGNITRQEMAVIVAKVLEKKGYEKASLEQLDIFKDQENIAEWAKSSISLCVKENIISGMGEGIFAPNEKATRAQAAVVLYKLYNTIK